MATVSGEFAGTMSRMQQPPAGTTGEPPPRHPPGPHPGGKADPPAEPTGPRYPRPTPGDNTPPRIGGSPPARFVMPPGDPVPRVRSGPRQAPSQQAAGAAAASAPASLPTPASQSVMEQRLAAMLPLEAGELLAAITDVDRGGTIGDLFIYRNGLVVTDEGGRASLLPFRGRAADAKGQGASRSARLLSAREVRAETLALEHRSALYVPFAHIATARVGGIWRWKLVVTTTKADRILLRSARGTAPGFATALRLIRLGILNQVARSTAAAGVARVKTSRLLSVVLPAGLIFLLAFSAALAVRNQSTLINNNLAGLASLPVCGPGAEATVAAPCLTQQPGRLIYAGPDPNASGTTLVQLARSDGSIQTEHLPTIDNIGTLNAARSVAFNSFIGTPVSVQADERRVPLDQHLDAMATTDSTVALVLFVVAALGFALAVSGLLGLRVNRRAGLVPPGTPSR